MKESSTVYLEFIVHSEMRQWPIELIVSHWHTHSHTHTQWLLHLHAIAQLFHLWWRSLSFNFSCERHSLFSCFHLATSIAGRKDDADGDGEMQEKPGLLSKYIATCLLEWNQWFMIHSTDDVTGRCDSCKWSRHGTRNKIQNGDEEREAEGKAEAGDAGEMAMWQGVNQQSNWENWDTIILEREERSK